MKIRTLIFLSGFLALSFSLAAAQENEVCFTCHGQKGSGAPFVDQKKFDASIHGRNLCVSCHKDATDFPHADKLKPVSCRDCHRLESEVYMNSDHGRALAKGKTEAATCVSCHGQTHTLLSSRNPLSPVNRKNIPTTCGHCHSNVEKMKQFSLTEREPVKSYMHSVHGEAFQAGKIIAAVCSDCHGTHDLHAAANPKSKINRANIPTTCGKCHENVAQTYKLSVHGRAAAAGIKEAPVCTDCHGEHTIRPIKDPASPVSAGSITKTCSSCHESERLILKFGLPANRLSSYQNSYHGLASRLGDLRAANCASCHGWHDVLPSWDPRSSVHPNNLANTCGRCHSGAQSKLLTGKVHGEGGADQHTIYRIVQLFYLIFIPLLIGWMVLHNLLDYFRKALRADPRGGSSLSVHEVNVLRLNGNERIQHGLLTITFITLAVSGFALKFPSSWWALPFLSGGEDLRKLVHRSAALVFSLTAVWHFVYLIFTRRGRFLLFHKLFPQLHDALDPLRMMAYNLGLKKTKPHLGYPSYVEKMEYWALIWGSFIMVATGSLLLFNDFTLKHFPLWISNLATMIHFYEALLASLAILVWHIYAVVFDPDVYPMNWSWLIGKLRLKSQKSKSDK